MSDESKRGVQPYWCASCGAELDAATGLDNDRRPKEGDVSICLYCGQLLIFDAIGTPLPPEDEAAVLRDCTEHQRSIIQRARELIGARR